MKLGLRHRLGNMQGAAANRFSGILDEVPGAGFAVSSHNLTRDWRGANSARILRLSDSDERNLTNVEWGDGTAEGFTGSENLVLHSEAFDNAYWAKNNLNISGTPAWVNAAEAPDGTMTAEKLIPDETLTAHQFLRDDFSYASSTFFTTSCYVKAAGRDYLLVQFIARNEGAGVSVISARVDLSNGTVSAVQSASYFTEVSAAIVDVGNGWYRASITGKTAATGADRLDFALRSTNSAWDTSVAGNNTDGYFIWGAQANTGSEAATYTKTTTGVSGFGTLATWHDQSGNARNATAAAPLQPRIVDAGTLDTVNGKPVAVFDGVDDSYSVAAGTLPAVSDWFMAVNLRSFTSGARLVQFGTTSVSALQQDATAGGNVTLELFIRTDGTSGRYRWTIPLDSFGILHLHFDTTTYTNSHLYLNGTQLTRNEFTAPVGTFTVPSGNLINIAGPTIFSDLTLGSFIYYPSDQSANRTAITDALIKHWGITV